MNYFQRILADQLNLKMKTVIIKVMITYYTFEKHLKTLTATRMLIYLAYRLNDDRNDMLKVVILNNINKH